MFLQKIVFALQKHKVEFAIVGGYAVALHGAVRGTVDIDIVLTLKDTCYQNAEAALIEIGLKPRLPVKASEIFEFRKEYIKNRNLIAWSFVNPQNPAEIVDIIINYELKTKDIEYKQSARTKIPILDIPALISMKKQSGRPQDLEDIKALEKIK